MSGLYLGNRLTRIAGFSWSPLMDGFMANSSTTIALIETATPNLEAHNRMVALSIFIEEEFQKERPNYTLIRTHLNEMKTLLNAHERNNIFIELFLAVVGIVTAPFAFLVGLLWILPTYIYSLPYLGTSAFLFDALQWFVMSIVDALRCLIFPIAIIHAYNKTGSMI